MDSMNLSEPRGTNSQHWNSFTKQGKYVLLVDEVDPGCVLLFPLFKVELDLLVAGSFILQLHLRLSLQDLQLKRRGLVWEERVSWGN